MGSREIGLNAPIRDTYIQGQRRVSSGDQGRHQDPK